MRVETFRRGENDDERAIFNCNVYVKVLFEEGLDSLMRLSRNVQRHAFVLVCAFAVRVMLL